MNNTITIWNAGSEVRKALLSSDKLKAKVHGAISPLIAKEGTKFPFIVYQKSGGWYEYNKDSVTGGTVSIDVIVFADKYEDLCEVCDLVDDAMYNYFTNAGSLPKLIGSDENFQDDTYYQPLTFQFKI